MADFFLRALLLLSFSLSSLSLYISFLPSTPPTFLNAAQTLTRSNHISMSLTLQLISQSLFTTSKSITIFAPPDSDFIKSGQPPLSLLKAHILTSRIPIDELKALPQGTPLPTLSPLGNLVVTSSFLDGNLSINNVRVKYFAIFDDGFVVIYEIDEFFNSSTLFSPVFAPRSAPEISSGSAQESSGSSGFDPNSTGFDPKSSGSDPKSSGFSPISSFEDPKSSGFDPNSDGFDSKLSGFSPTSPFSPAISFLRSKGYHKMGAFLDMQLGLGGFRPMEGIKLTIFAPVDEAFDDHALNFLNYSTVFRAHVVPTLLRGIDLIMMRDDTLLDTFSEDGFRISVRKSGDIVLVNGVPVIFADMYCTDWLVIHGLSEAILPPRIQELKQSIKESLSGLDYHDDDVDSDFEDHSLDYDDGLNE